MVLVLPHSGEQKKTPCKVSMNNYYFKIFYLLDPSTATDGATAKTPALLLKLFAM